MNQRAEDAFRADIVEVGRRMYNRAYVASNDGNISIRLDDTTILTTPKSVSKGSGPDMWFWISTAKIRGPDARRVLMHREVYRIARTSGCRPLSSSDCDGFAVADPLDRAVLAEVVTTSQLPIPNTATVDAHFRGVRSTSSLTTDY